MIRIKSFGAKNFGHYKSFERKKIIGNVLGLSGISGSGKSTILQIVEWLSTGSIVKPGVTKEAISEWVRRTEDGSVVKKMEGWGELEVDGSPLRIERSVSLAGTSTRSLMWDGKEKKGAAEVDTLLAELFGADQKIISSLVFIRQGSFGQLFSGLDSDRLEFFVRLLALGGLAKIATSIDIQRKQMMGTVTDLSAVKDQSELAYNAAREYFEAADHSLSRMRSYAADIAGGVDLSMALEHLATREATSATSTTAFNEGLQVEGLSASQFAKWAADTNDTLAKLREDLKVVVDRRKTRAAYEARKSQLTSEIVTVSAWLEKKSRLEGLNAELTACGNLDQPDPRVRMARLAALMKAHQDAESAKAAWTALPVITDAEVEHFRSLWEVSKADAEVAAGDNTAFQKARADLSDLEALQKTLTHGVGAQCKVCGNDHPDPVFLATAITNTTELEKRLGAQSVVSRTIANASALAAGTADDALKNRRSAIERAEAEYTRLALMPVDFIPIDQNEKERAELEAALPAYDKARSLRDHLTQQRDAIVLGFETYTPVDITNREADLALADQVLKLLPLADELDATENQLTTDGVALRSKLDRLAALFETANRDGAAYREWSSTLADKVATLSKERPFLISSIAALGPVMTAANVAEVLVTLRQRQTEFDSQTGVVKAATQAMNDANATLQELETKIAEQKSRIIIAKELEAVRAAFLPTGITTDYLNHQFERIAVVTQDHLAQMSADFMAVASEDRALSFNFLRLNEAGAAWLSQNRMSGGQQVKLAIAVILAIHELVIPQVGLLVLDEPSTHLDLDSRVALAEVLREIGRRGNFQLIVCDHSPELKEAYTDTIELSSEPDQ